MLTEKTQPVLKLFLEVRLMLHICCFYSTKNAMHGHCCLSMIAGAQPSPSWQCATYRPLQQRYTTPGLF